MFEITTHQDTPVKDAHLLGHDVLINQLEKFLVNPNIAGPFSIGMHAPWGSGKTSVMRTLEKRLSHSNVDVLFFEAWRHENSNPGLTLISYLLNRYVNDQVDKKIILKSVGNILSQKFLNMDLTDIIDSFTENQITDDAIFSQSNQFAIDNKIENKLVIIIDDLDRCDVENTLEILSIMKLFLDSSKIICIAAVDFKRLEQAWHQKYGTDEKSEEEGKSYLQKIFQVRIGMPTPNKVQLTDYYQSLSTWSDKRQNDVMILNFLKEIGPQNPRAIKRMLNLASFRMSQLNEQSIEAQNASILWTVLESLIQENSHKVFQELEKALADERDFTKILSSKPIRVLFTEPKIAKKQDKIQFWIESFLGFLNNADMDKKKFSNFIRELNEMTQEIQ